MVTIFQSDDAVTENEELDDEDSTLDEDLLDEVDEDSDADEDVEGFGLVDEKESEDDEEEEEKEESLEDDAEDMDYDSFDDVDEM